MQRLCKSRAESSSLLECYAEPPPILCKHFANECKESFTLNLPSAAKCYAKIYFFSDTSKHLVDFKFHAPTDDSLVSHG